MHIINLIVKSSSMHMFHLVMFNHNITSPIIYSDFHILSATPTSQNPMNNRCIKDGAAYGCCGVERSLLLMFLFVCSVFSHSISISFTRDELLDIRQHTISLIGVFLKLLPPIWTSSQRL